jgi:hypothetical protein
MKEEEEEERKKERKKERRRRCMDGMPCMHASLTHASICCVH